MVPGDGIIQGCRLSIFLFSILLTCLLTEANEAVEERFGVLKADVSMTRSIVYADDILLVDVDVLAVQFFMDGIERFGKCYGLLFNTKKLEPLANNIEDDLLNSTSHLIKQKKKIVYLGSILNSNGHIHSELGRRIGAANQAFKELESVWIHAGINWRQKLR